MRRIILSPSMKIIGIRPRTLFIIAFFIPATMYAETGYDAWLRYAALDQAAAAQYSATVPATVATLGNNALEASGRDEIIRGIHGMLGRTLRIEPRVPAEGAIVLGTLAEFRRLPSQFGVTANLDQDAYRLKTAR